MVGGQITSSVAIPSGVGATGLGYGEAADVNYVSETANVIVKYTYRGDANLDGQVDVTDLGRLATNWQTSGDWVDGDFDYSGFIDVTDLGILATNWQQNGEWVNADYDYSGFVDVTDLGILATNWQQGVGSPLSMSFSEAMALFPEFSGVSIPEPASLGLLAFGVMGLMGRRRRK